MSKSRLLWGGVGLGLVLVLSLNANSQSPVPNISSVSPNRIAVGSASTQVSVFGSGFTSGTAVRLNDSQSLVTTFVSANELQAIIPDITLTTVSLLQLTVFNGTSGAGTATVTVYSAVPPKITGVTPGAAARQSTVLFTFSGSSLIGSDLLFDSPGIQVQGVFGTDSSLVFNVAIGADAMLGSRVAMLSKPGIGSSTATVQIIDGGAWQPVNIPDAANRASASVTTLTDGRILVAGGYNNQTNPINPIASAGLISPSDLSWQDVAPMNVPRWGHQAVLLGAGRVLVYGGNTIGGSTSSAEIFDPVANSWSLAGFVRNVFAPPVLLPNGKVLLLPDELYDPRTQASARINGATPLAGSNPQGQGRFGGVLMDNGSVYFTGGYDDNNSGAVLRAGIYNPLTDSTRTVSSILIGAVNVPSGQPILLPDGKVFIKVSFRLTNNAGSSSYVYDFSTDHATPVSISTLGIATLLPTGKVIVLGARFNGDGRGFVFTPEAVIFDPSLNAVNPAATPVFVSVGNSSSLNDGRILVGPTSPALYSPESYVAPVPAVSSISIFDSRSNGDLTIRISGGNFLSDSTVRYGSMRLRTIYAGAKTLFAFVPASAIAAAPDDMVTVANPEPGGGNSTPLPIGANATPPVPGIVGITPSTGAQGTSVSAVINGTNLLELSSVTFTGSGITSTIRPGGSSTQTPVSLVIDPSAAPGSRDVTVVTAGGSATLSSGFVVQRANVPVGISQPIPEVEQGSIQTGYVIVTPDSSSAAPTTTVTFGIVNSGIVQSQAGMFPGPMMSDGTLFAETIPGIGRNLGVAIANPGNTALSLVLSLLDTTGVTVGSPVTVTLQGQQQMAKFISELFPADTVGAGFRGSLRLRSSTSFASTPFSALGLRFSGQEFSTLPVAANATIAGVPTRTLAAGSVANTPLAGAVGGSGSIILPQFAMGGGWATQLALVNSGAAGITGRVDFFDMSGNPIALKLNDNTQSTFTYSVAAGGTFVLAPRDANGQSPF
jgi:hypothetical protein